MQKMLILHGLPACGKSTYRKELMEREPGVWGYVNFDELRHADPNWVWTPQGERDMQDTAFSLAYVILAGGQDLIVDNTNLNPKTLNRWVQFAEKHNVEWETVYFKTPLDECIRRNALRTGWQHVPRPVIERMALFGGLLDLPTDKKLVLVDMDGTLADCEHRRHFLEIRDCLMCVGTGCAKDGETDCTYCKGRGHTKKNWDGFYGDCISDPPVESILTWVKALGDDPDFLVCIVSGRPTDRAGNQTVAWLEKHNVPYDRIFMRAARDHRPDYMVKQEILDRLPKSQIAFCIDDRDQVVSMWRRNGLTVYQVAEGNF